LADLVSWLLILRDGRVAASSGWGHGRRQPSWWGGAKHRLEPWGRDGSARV